MDSNIIKFRLSPELLELLESVKDSDESLHQAARRILESSLKVRTQLGHTEQEVVHREQEESTQLRHSRDEINEVVREKIEELESDLYSRIVDQVSGLIEVRLGE
jgi:molecular chaperone DnaK (HSP70)